MDDETDFEPQLRWANMLLDALIAHDPDEPDDNRNVDAVSRAFELAQSILPDLGFAVSVTPGQPPTLDMSTLVSASLLPVVVLLDRVAELEGTSREQAIAETRERLEEGWATGN